FVLAETVSNPGIVERNFSRYGLLPGEFVGQANLTLDREPVIGVRMLVHGIQIGEELGCGADHARLFEHDAGIIVQLGYVIGADAADRSGYSQLFGASEEIAVAPISLQAQPFGIRGRRAKPEISELAFAHLDI